MKQWVLVFILLAGCASLPPEGTPYFESTASGDNLYPAVSTRIYATDQKISTEAPHPYNNNRGRRSIVQVPGGFAQGLAALDATPPDTPTPQGPIVGPDVCCHVFVARTYSYFDGNTSRGIGEYVWRQAAGVPPFMDEAIAPE